MILDRWIRPRHRPRMLLLGNVSQKPFNNNLVGPVRAFERACEVTVIEPWRLEGFRSTGAAAPAPIPLASVAPLLAGLEPEIVLCLAGAIFVPDEVKRLLPASAVYVGLTFSDPIGLAASIAIAPHFDLFYTHDPGSLPAFAAAGLRVRESALAVDDELFAPLPVPKRWDVFFAGKWTPRRQEVVHALSGVCRVRLHGHEGETRWDPRAGPTLVTPESLAEAIASAHLSLEFAVIDDYPPPIGGSWRITPRAQFAAACGVPSLVEDHPLLARYFVPGREIVTYRSIPELLDRVLELVARPGECARIGKRARARVRREQLWEHRVAAILADVREHLAGSHRS